MKKILIAISLVLTLALAAGAAVVMASDRTVQTLGGESLTPNVMVSSNLRFSPGPLYINSGDTVTWVHGDSTQDPHTITLATKDQLIKSVEDLFGNGCPACSAAANAALAGHFSTQPPTVFVDANHDGAFSTPGDSLLLFPGARLTEKITAPSGTTLYYFCAFHPWMQGTIVVK